MRDRYHWCDPFGCPACVVCVAIISALVMAAASAVLPTTLTMASASAVFLAALTGKSAACFSL